MSSLRFTKKSALFIIPIAYLIWCIAIQLVRNHFYYRQIDPEFPYLLNGLNCSILQFNRIGHVDHPGTPFQILTGILIRIVHFIIGRNSIEEDVFSRPDVYLAACSTLLAVFTSFILWRAGRIALKTSGNIFLSLIIQTSAIASLILSQLPARYIPERLLVILVISFMGLCLHYLYGQYNYKKFAILSGVLLGITVVTKIHSIPLIIIPLFLLTGMKPRLIYSGSLTISILINILPVKNRFPDFRHFISGIIKHDGLYGGGNQRFINTSVFFQNMAAIIKDNYFLTISIILSIIIIIILLSNKTLRNRFGNEFRYLLAFLGVTLLSLILVAKHYKGYYIIPVVCLSIFTFIIVGRIILNKVSIKYLDLIYFIAIAFILIMSNRDLYKHYKWDSTFSKEQEYFAAQIKKTVADEDYIIIKPTWKSAPLPANALIYGISYVRHPHLYYNTIEKYYPNILTWISSDPVFRHFRTRNKNLETLLYSGRNIYLFDDQSNNCQKVIDQILNEAEKYQVQFKTDSVVMNVNSNEYLIQLSNQSSWRIKSEKLVDFENSKIPSISKAENINFDQKDAIINSNYAYSGLHSLKVTTNNKILPLSLFNLSEGDLIEVSLKQKTNNKPKGNTPGTININFHHIDSTQINVIDKEDYYRVGNNWAITNKIVELTKQLPDSSLMINLIVEGENDVYLDDLHIRHYSKN